MIQNNELRIGNYFLDRGGKILQLHFWDGPGKLAMNNVVGGLTFHPYTEESTHASPIPITEEWLERFGFEWEDIVTKTTGETEKMLCKGILMMQRHHDTMWAACPYGYPLNPHQSIYVHQLQNLYFALTGEELTIKESL